VGLDAIRFSVRGLISSCKVMREATFLFVLYSISVRSVNRAGLQLWHVGRALSVAWP